MNVVIDILYRGGRTLLRVTMPGLAWTFPIGKTAAKALHAAGVPQVIQI